MDGLGADLWRQLGAQWVDWRERIGFGDRLTLLPGWMAPGLALGALLGLVALSGIALAALGVLLTALFLAALLLEAVFGLRVELRF
ncbi:MAG: hypothetical protein SF182_15550 [Deltaproteobacteria bacterium]|nr:hypothetical protein [Deltaproteobacteria bacterium]